MTDISESLLKKEIELIVLRLETLPPDIFFYSGNGSQISRNEMIEHVTNNDDIGREYIDIEMEFLRALKDGKLMKQMLQGNSSGSSIV